MGWDLAANIKGPPGDDGADGADGADYDGPAITIVPEDTDPTGYPDGLFIEYVE